MYGRLQWISHTQKHGVRFTFSLLSRRFQLIVAALHIHFLSKRLVFDSFRFFSRFFGMEHISPEFVLFPFVLFEQLVFSLQIEIVLFWASNRVNVGTLFSQIESCSMHNNFGLGAISERFIPYKYFVSCLCFLHLLPITYAHECESITWHIVIIY